MNKIEAKKLADQLVGGQVGDWLITDTISVSGKSALVLKGTKDSDTVAVKVFDPELIERFGSDKQSARIQRELSLRGHTHPNLVTIRDGGFCERTNLWFIVMEYIDAPNLAEQIRDVPRDAIGNIISQIASAANFLEDLQLAHRDIKPDNIAIYPDFKRAVLLDLGVIRPFGLSDMTDEDQVTFVGTLQYSSPEFLLRDEVDTMEGWRAVTFYQLGAVLHDMIMQQRIFSEFAEPYGRLVKAIADETPRIDATDVPPDLILLAKNCLQKDPALRLSFVAWKDFESSTEGVSSIEAAKERIRKRQGLTASKERDATHDAQLDRLLRRTIQTTRTRLEDIVRQEFIRSELFLPIEVQEFAEDEPCKLGFLIFIKASQQLGLSYSVSLIFRVELIDVASHAITIYFSAAVSDVALSKELILSGAAAKVFKGVFEESVMPSLIERLVYPTLDQAQQIDRNTSGLSGGKAVWLNIPQGEEHNE